MALAKDRNTKSRMCGNWSYKVGTGVKIYAGALVALNATGFLVPGSTATTLTAAGRAEVAVDNTSGADGAVRCEVTEGVFLFKNSAADPVVQADVGKDCYIVDDETVAHTNGTNTRSRAGKVREVEAAGVWVQLGVGR